MANNIQFTPYPFEINPKKINHFGEGVIQELNHIQIIYVVRGTAFFPDVNTKLSIDKWFSDLVGANQYFKDIIEKFPLSEVIIEKQETTELRIYV